MMHFSNPILRPPYEARSVYLQVTTGCSHNRCSYCSYYKDIEFSISPKEEIINDLKELKNNGYSFKRIWLQSADPFTLSTKKLEEIAGLIMEYLPFVESIGCYSRVDSLKNKTIADLKKLKKRGYNSIAFGIESGDDYLLEYADKGYTARDITEQISKMDKAGIKYTLIFLSGLGGEGYGYKHAEKTAEIINLLHPERVMITGLTLFEDTPLMNEHLEGKFWEAREEERTMELQRFIEKLEVETFLDATNASNTIPIFGRIPENKDAMISHLQESYQKIGENGLRKKREKSISQYKKV